MKEEEYYIIENSWKHRIISILEKEQLDFRDLKKAVKLNDYAINKALSELYTNEIIMQNKKGNYWVYEIIGKYQIRRRNESEQKADKDELLREEKLEKILSREDIPTQEQQQVIFPLAEDELTTKFISMIDEANDNIFVISPFLMIILRQENY